MAKKRSRRRTSGQARRQQGGTSKPQDANVKAAVCPIHSFELRITLKSDLCSGSGDGFSSGIDQDVCYDAQGLPYIPARRIKGCLREAALDIDLEREWVDALFGVRGSQDGGALSIANATMVAPDTSGGALATLDRYTYTRAQTKVDRESGSAKDETLRYVRVAKHYREDESETAFVAAVTLDESKLAPQLGMGQARRQLRNCARSLRNMGMGRNRGLGAVRCVCNDVTESAAQSKGQLAKSSAMVHEMRVGDVVALSYAVRLDAPVMLPQSNGDRGHPCIPGTSVMGFFAGQLRDDPRFDDMFFGGRVRFSPLYPLDAAGTSANRCLPASAFLAKVKGGLRDGEYCRADAFEAGPLESMKPLRDGFVSPATWTPIAVATEIAYHHSRGEDSTLYTQECLSAGQLMAGFVECPCEWASAFKEVLSQGRLRFGRSKSTQYARCSLVGCARDHSGLGSKMDIVDGGKYALLLESDALVPGTGAQSATFAYLERALVEGGVLGPWYKGCDAEDASVEHCVTSVTARTVGGYNAKWNQKKPQVRVLEAGSCIVFTAESSAGRVAATGSFGARQPEGYGRVRLVRLGDVVPRRSQATQDAVPLLDVREAARLAALSYADDVRAEFFMGGSKLTGSFVGRLAMMVEESGLKGDLSFDGDLDARIASIKDSEKSGKQESARRLVDGLRKRLGGLVWCGQADNWRIEKECLLMVLTLGKYYQKQTNEGGAAR